MTDQTDDTSQESPPAKSTRPRLRIALLIAVCLGLIAAVYWGYGYITVGRFQEETNNAYVQADSVPVAPKVTGYVREVLVSDNEFVEIGQPLARIDASDYQSTVDAFRAQLAAANAQIVAARAAVDEQSSSVAQARAQVRAATVGVEYAKGSARRYAVLSEAGAETVERYDNSRYDVDRAKAERNVRQKALASAQGRFPALRGQIGVALAQRDVIAAQLAQAVETQEDTIIRATVAGTVGSKTVRVGQFVQPGQRLMTIVPSRELYIIANFKETQLARIRVGQPVSIEIDSLSGATLSGEVESLAPATGAEFSLIKPENATGNFTKIVQRIPVRIRIFAGPTAEKFLRAGLSATVSVNTKGTDEDLENLEDESRKMATSSRR